MTTQKKIILEFFQANPTCLIKQSEAVDWAVAEYQQRTGKKFRQPGSMIRALHHQGILVREGRGVYRYASSEERRKFRPFTSEQKSHIMKRDRHRCVCCGQGIRVKHIIPVNKGGESEVVNGWTLCDEHSAMLNGLTPLEAAMAALADICQSVRGNGDRKKEAFGRALSRIGTQYRANTCA